MTDNSDDTRHQGPPGSQALRNQALGRYGEEVAARHLVSQGMVVLDCNVRDQRGEIDVLCRDGRVLVACEVKTRSSAACGTPHEAVDQAKLARVRSVAERWARDHGLVDVDIRVDLVAVWRPPKGRAQVEHLPGIA